MSNAPVDKGRRFLTVATSVVGGAGAVAVAVPFIASWNPSAKAKNAGAPVEVNIRKAEPGQLVRVKWRGKPVWVVRRTPDMLEELGDIEDKLRDPNFKSRSSHLMRQINIAQLKKNSSLRLVFVPTLVALHLILRAEWGNTLRALSLAFSAHATVLNLMSQGAYSKVFLHH